MHQTSEWRWLAYLRILMRYGLAIIRYSRLALAAYRDHFSRMYDMQAGGTTWASPQELLQATGLYEYTQVGGWQVAVQVHMCTHVTVQVHMCTHVTVQVDTSGRQQVAVQLDTGA